LKLNLNPLSKIILNANKQHVWPVLCLFSCWEQTTNEVNRWHKNGTTDGCLYSHKWKGEIRDRFMNLYPRVNKFTYLLFQDDADIYCSE
jgi:hypothetical protein